MSTFILMFSLGCVGPATTTPLPSPTGDTGATSTIGLTEPQPSWRSAAAEAVVWHGAEHTHAGADLLILDNAADAPQLVIGAPRPTDLGGPFPVVIEEVGPRLMVAPFDGGLVQDEAVTAWLLPEDTPDPEFWMGEHGKWLSSGFDLLGTSETQVLVGGKLYASPAASSRLRPDDASARLDVSAPILCQLDEEPDWDVVALEGYALGPVTHLQHADLATVFAITAETGTTSRGCVDADDDGQQEILFAVARAGSLGGSSGGELYAWPEPPSGDSGWVRDLAEVVWTGPELLGRPADRGLVTGGDMNGDGIPDVFLGAPNAEVPAASGFPTTGGRAWVLTDPLAGGELDVGAHAIFEPTFDHDRIGAHATFGDFDGDGADDIAISYASPSRVAVFRGPLDAGTYTDEDADAVFYGQGTLDDGFGLGLAAGDLDEDGRDDLVIGAPLDDTEGRNGGAVYLLWGGGL